MKLLPMLSLLLLVFLFAGCASLTETGLDLAGPDGRRFVHEGLHEGKDIHSLIHEKYPGEAEETHEKMEASLEEPKNTDPEPE